METDGNALVCLSATGYQSTQKIKKTNKEKANEKKASWTDSEEVQTFSQSLGRWFLNLDIFFSLLAFIKLTLFPLSKKMTEGKHRAEEDYRNFGFFFGAVF